MKKTGFKKPLNIVWNLNNSNSKKPKIQIIITNPNVFRKIFSLNLIILFIFQNYFNITNIQSIMQIT